MPGSYLIGLAIVIVLPVVALIGVTVNVVDKRINPEHYNEQIVILAKAISEQKLKIDEIEAKLASKSKK